VWERSVVGRVQVSTSSPWALFPRSGEGEQAAAAGEDDGPPSGGVDTTGPEAWIDATTRLAADTRSYKASSISPCGVFTAIATGNTPSSMTTATGPK
jgi:hypothetical protein